MSTCRGVSCSNAPIIPTSIFPFGIFTITTQLKAAFPQCPKCPRAATHTSYVGIIVISVLIVLLCILYFIFERHEKRKSV
jgi:hypothetical protein